MQARLSALLAGDVRADSGGAVMHAVSVTSWLTEAEPDARTPTDVDDQGGQVGKGYRKVLLVLYVRDEGMRPCSTCVLLTVCCCRVVLRVF